MDKLPSEESKRKLIELMTPERETKIMAGIERKIDEFKITFTG